MEYSSNNLLYLCISLDRTPERWESFKNRFQSRFDFLPNKLSAVDAKHLSLEELQQWLPVNKQDYVCGRELIPSEVACALSHQKAWELLANSDAEWALVMEDDVIFSENPSIDFIVKDPSWIPDDVDIVQIGSYTKQAIKYRALKLESIGENFSLAMLFEPISYGTQAYWIRKSAVPKAQAHLFPLIAPIDNIMFDIALPFMKACQVRSLIPFVCFDPESSSTIGEERHKAPKTSKRKQNLFQYLHKKLLKRLSKKLTRNFINVEIMS